MYAYIYLNNIYICTYIHICVHQASIINYKINYDIALILWFYVQGCSSVRARRSAYRGFAVFLSVATGDKSCNGFWRLFAVRIILFAILSAHVYTGDSCLSTNLCQTIKAANIYILLPCDIFMGNNSIFIILLEIIPPGWRYAHQLNIILIIYYVYILIIPLP